MEHIGVLHVVDHRRIELRLVNTMFLQCCQTIGIFSFSIAHIVACHRPSKVVIVENLFHLVGLNILAWHPRLTTYSGKQEQNEHEYTDNSFHSNLLYASSVFFFFLEKLSDIVSNSFLQKSKRHTTPTLMLASAKLNTGLKNINCSPPLNGNHSG